MRQLTVITTSASYPVCIGRETLACPEAGQALRAAVAGRACLVISDSQVGPLYGAAARRALEAAGAVAVRAAVFPAGEAAKTLDTVAGLYREAVAAGLDRTSAVVALGGGVAGDVAGFVAATFLRGIMLVQMPTSLLAMVDSSVGGKVGVDLPEGKNLVGAFHQPVLVLADLACLGTLPPREWRCGLAEIVKYGMSLDAALFRRLASETGPLLAGDPALIEDIVARCCQLKAEVVGADEREESGRRVILNYGHTFGHAIEALGGYTGLNHGEAVAVGMAMAADLAVALGRLPPAAAAEQERLLTALHLPVRLDDPRLTADRMLDAMRRDKKSRGGRLRLVLPTDIGRVEVVADPDESLVRQVIGGRRGSA